MVPPERTQISMVSRKHISHFYLPFAFRPPTSENDLLENVDIAIFAIDLSFLPRRWKISSRSSNSPYQCTTFCEGSALSMIYPDIVTGSAFSYPLSVSPRL